MGKNKQEQKEKRKREKCKQGLVSEHFVLIYQWRQGSLTNDL